MGFDQMRLKEIVQEFNLFMSHIDHCVLIWYKDLNKKPFDGSKLHNADVMEACRYLQGFDAGPMIRPPG
jgi:hypothetical protein